MKTASVYRDRRVVRGRRGPHVALITALTVLVLFVLPAGASGTEPTPAAFTVEGTVTWVGGPDSRATVSVGACPIDEQGPRCPSFRRTTAAADGSYTLALPYGRPSSWNVFAIISVGSSFPGVSIAVGASTEVTVPRSPHAPLPLAISTRAVGMRVVDGEGNAFPEGTASVMASPTSTVGWSVAGADANGDALLFVDPAVEYNVNAFALNTGWPDPWVSPDGTEFHFSQNGVTALGANLEEGSTFVIARPTGVLLRVVDGQGNPFPAGMAGVHACDRSGNRDPECVGAMDTDGDGIVLLPPLDPTARWEVYGVAVNTGWPDPWVSPDGTEYHFSATVTVEPGGVLENGAVFVVAEPTGTLLRVVDDQGNPFPAGTAGVNACDTSGTRDPVCIGTTDTDGDGNVLLVLDPTTPWWVYGWAINTGWPEPSWVGEDGTQFHFSEPVTLDPGVELEDGTVFMVAEPGTA